MPKAQNEPQRARSGQSVKQRAMRITLTAKRFAKRALDTIRGSSTEPESAEVSSAVNNVGGAQASDVAQLEKDLHNAERRESRWKQKTQELRINVQELESAKDLELTQAALATADLRQRLEAIFQESSRLRFVLSERDAIVAGMRGSIDDSHARAEQAKEESLDRQQAMESIQTRIAVLEKRTEAQQKRIGRSPAKQARAVQKEVSKVQNTRTQLSQKEKGVVSEKFRRLYRHLVDEGVGRAHVDAVIHAVLGAADITVNDKVSARTVSRTVLERGIHAQVQLGAEIAETEGESAMNVHVVQRELTEHQLSRHAVMVPQSRARHTSQSS
jgi:hypothetical protein